jgi:hypothetical protein
MMTDVSYEHITYSKGYRVIIPAEVLGQILFINQEYYCGGRGRERDSHLLSLRESLWDIILEEVLTQDQRKDVYVSRGDIRSMANLIGDDLLEKEITTSRTMAGQRGGKTPSQIFSPRDDVWYGTDVVFLFQ